MIPYNPQRFADERIFVGREETISELSSGLQSGHSFGIIGKAGIGKTSLLFAVKRQLILQLTQESMIVPIPIYLEFDKHRLTNLGDIFEAILSGFIDAINDPTRLAYTALNREQLLEEGRSGKFEPPFHYVLEWYFKKYNRSCRLIILFDDLHRGIKCEWLHQAISTLRRFVSLGEVCVILSGELPLEKELRNDISSLRALVTGQKILEPLTSQEVAKLIGVAELYGWEVEMGCEELVYKLTQGHPYRLHYYLFTALNQFGKINNSVINIIHNDLAIQKQLRIVLKQRTSAVHKLSKIKPLRTSEDLNLIVSNTPDTQETGGISMSIEQDALQIAEFLRSLRKQIIEHPEFGKFYGDAGRIDEQVEQLAAALTTNFQLLKEARNGVALYPGNILNQNMVQMHLHGLEVANQKAETLWHQFNAITLSKTKSLIVRLEEETPEQIEQGGAEEAAQLSTTQTNAKSSSKQSWLNNTLAGLNIFKDFLTTSSDIRKAVGEWSPILIETVRSTFDQLGHLMGQIKL